MPLPDLRTQLQTLIATPSISSTNASHDSSNRAVVEQLAHWLEELGFHCELLPTDASGEKFNLIATLGTGPGGLVLAGHTDTVPYDDQRWDSDPFQLTEKDGKWYGLGTTDMKGFFPVVLAAIERCRDRAFKQPLIVLATADEESSMSGAKALVAMGRPLGRYALIGEPTNLEPVRMHKGIMMEALDVHGKSGHSSNPALGINAIDGLHSALEELMALRRSWRSQYQHDGFAIGYPTMNFGCVHGGDNPNRICANAELQFDVRLLPGMDPDDLRREIQGRLAPLTERTGSDYRVRPLIDGIPAFEQSADSDLVRACEQLTGHNAISVAFTTEAPYFQQLGLETVVMGPGDIALAHQPNEYLDTAQIEPAIAVVEQLIERFCR